MIWLTRIRVSPMEAAKLRLADSYAWHQALWRAFPDRDGRPRDFLSRIDQRGGMFEALLLSQAQPTPQAWGQWDTKQVPLSFLEHDRYRFSLRANPTVMRVVRNAAGDRRKNGRRTAIFQSDDLQAWLHRKSEAAGFRVEEFVFDPPVREAFRRQGRAGLHVRVDFRGTLAVTDRDRFQAAFREGLGPARAFGFGMLLLEPLS